MSGLTLIVKCYWTDLLLCRVDQRDGLSCTWIDTGLNGFIGVGHLPQAFLRRKAITFGTLWKIWKS